MIKSNPDKAAQMRAWHRGPRDVTRFLWRYYRWHFITAFVVAFVFGFTLVYTFISLFVRM